MFILIQKYKRCSFTVISVSAFYLVVVLIETSGNSANNKHYGGSKTEKASKMNNIVSFSEILTKYVNYISKSSDP